MKDGIYLFGKRMMFSSMVNGELQETIHN